jgi:hypothetical protein
MCETRRFQSSRGGDETMKMSTVKVGSGKKKKERGSRVGVGIARRIAGAMRDETTRRRDER